MEKYESCAHKSKSKIVGFLEGLIWSYQIRRICHALGPCVCLYTIMDRDIKFSVRLRMACTHLNIWNLIVLCFLVFYNKLKKRKSNKLLHSADTAFFLLL